MLTREVVGQEVGEGFRVFKFRIVGKGSSLWWGTRRQ